MKKTFFLIIVIMMSLSLFAQKNLAIVSEVGGVAIFSYCMPTSKYEVLGEIGFSGKGDSHLIMMGTNFMYGSSEVQYTEMSRGLVSQAVLANRETEGIIIKDEHATMIKFTDPNENHLLGLAQMEKGLYIFVDSQPVSKYDYITNKKGPLAASVKELVPSLLKRANKVKKEHNAVIIHFETGGYDNVDVINIKD